MGAGLVIALICFMLFPIIPLMGLFVTSLKDEIDRIPTYNRITFDRFLAFYNINPNRWCLDDDRVIYKRDMRLSYLNTTFQFNFIDLMKYKCWRKRLEKLERAEIHQRYRQVQLEEYQEVLECVKKDLEKFTRENDEMMKCETEKYVKRVDEVPKMFDDIFEAYEEQYLFKGGFTIKSLEE